MWTSTVLSHICQLYSRKHKHNTFVFASIVHKLKEKSQLMLDTQTLLDLCPLGMVSLIFLHWRWQFYSCLLNLMRIQVCIFYATCRSSHLLHVHCVCILCVFCRQYRGQCGDCRCSRPERHTAAVTCCRLPGKTRQDGDGGEEKRGKESHPHV